MAGESGGIRMGKAFVELFADNSKFAKGLQGAEAQWKKFGNNIASKGALLTGAATAVLAPIAAASKAFADQGSALHYMSKRTGMSVESLSALEHVANQTGTTMDTMENGIRRVQTVLGDPTAANTLQEMGFNVDALRKMSPENMFLAISDSIGKVTSQYDRAAIAQKVFGKGGQEMADMMARGGGEMRKMMKDAQRLGIVMSKEDAAAASTLGSAMGTLQLQLKRLTANVGAALAPTLTRLAERLSEIIPPVSRWVRDNEALIVSVAKGTVTLLKCGVALMVIGKSISLIGSAMGVIRTSLPILKLLAKALVSPWVLLPVAVGAAVVVLSGRFGEMRDSFNMALGGIKASIMRGDIKGAWNIMTLGLKSIWEEMTLGFKLIWDGAIHYLSRGWVIFSSTFGIENIVLQFKRLALNVTKIWDRMIYFMKSAWDATVKGLSKAFVYATVWDKRERSDILKAMDENFDETALSRLRDFEKGLEDIEKAAGGIGKQLAVNKEKTDSMLAALDKVYEEQQLARIKRVDDLRKELKEAVESAKKVPDTQKDGAYKRKGEEITLRPAIDKVGASVGSFFASQARALSSGGEQSRFQSKVVDLLQGIERNTSSPNGAVFT